MQWRAEACERNMARPRGFSLKPSALFVAARLCRMKLSIGIHIEMLTLILVCILYFIFGRASLH